MGEICIKGIVLTREDGSFVRAEKKPSWPKDQKVKHISLSLLVSCKNYKQKDVWETWCKKNSFSSTWNYRGQRYFNGIHCSLKEEIAHFSGWNILTSKRQWVNKNDLGLLSGLKLWIYEYQTTPVQSQLLVIHTMIFFYVFWSIRGTMFFFSTWPPVHLKRVCNHMPETLWVFATLWMTYLEAVNLGYVHRIAAMLLLAHDKRGNMTRSWFFYFYQILLYKLRIAHKSRSSHSSVRT